MSRTDGTYIVGASSKESNLAGFSASALERQVPPKFLALPAGGLRRAYQRRDWAAIATIDAHAEKKEFRTAEARRAQRRVDGGIQDRRFRIRAS